MKNIIIFVLLLSIFSCRSVKKDKTIDREIQTSIKVERDSILTLNSFDLKSLSELKTIEIRTFDTFDSAGTVVFKPISISITERKEQLAVKDTTSTLSIKESEDTDITTQENIRVSETKKPIKFSFIRYLIIFVVFIIVTYYVLRKTKFI